MSGQVPIFFSHIGDIPGGALPPSIGVQFGGGGALSSFGLEGNINRQVSAGINPASTAADIVLAIFILPAGCFDQAGRGINLLAIGSFAANTNTKTIKMIYNPTTAVVGSVVSGGTTIASGTANTVATAGGWNLEANIFKYGILGSNTQIGLHTAFQSGNAVGALVAPAALTAPENAAILLAITGNAATTTTDIALNLFEINAMN